MNDLYIKVTGAEDSAGEEFNLDALQPALRDRGADKWEGRELALVEIAAGFVVDDLADLDDEPDSAVAAYLILTRCDNDDDLPEITLCNAELAEHRV